MLKKFNATVFIIGLIFLQMPLKSQEVLDGIVAIVGEEMVLRSELLLSSQQAAIQMRINPVSQPEAFDDLMDQILDNMINQKVLLAKAKEDTVIVEDQRVEAAMEERIQYMVQELGSVENVEKQFGAPISKIKRDNWDEMKNSLTVSKGTFNKEFYLEKIKKRAETLWKSIELIEKIEDTNDEEYLDKYKDLFEKLKNEYST